MITPSQNSEREQLDDARQLQHWVRKYAQNRSLPVVAGLAAFVLLFVAISVPSYWGGMAYRNGNMALFIACLVIVIVATAATIYLSVPRWGGRRMQQVAEAIYAREGSVTIWAPRAHRPWLMAAIGLAFGVCVVGSVILGLLGYLPNGKYIQPISALYVVPFMIALNFLMRPAAGYIPLLWPFLYALHAILIVVGVPIAFVGAWESLNMIVPVVGYGTLTSLVGHVYSRWALHKARAITSRQLDRADFVKDGGQA
jgi:hypothetical protein